MAIRLVKKKYIYITAVSLPPSLVQLLGGGLIGVGAWLEVSERSLIAAIQQQTFLVGPYLIIAAGCVIVIISAIGMIGAFCDKKINRFLLVFVSLFSPATTSHLIMWYISSVHHSSGASFPGSAGGWDPRVCVSRPGEVDNLSRPDDHSA